MSSLWVRRAYFNTHNYHSTSCYQWRIQAFQVRCWLGNVRLRPPKYKYIKPAQLIDLLGPKRALGSQIPLDVYLQIFAWLKPVADPDSDIEIYNTTLARLALVCRYFAYYATREFWRYLDLNGNKNLRRRMPAEPWCDAILTQLQPAETLRTDVKECKIRSWVLLINLDIIQPYSQDSSENE